MEGEEDDEVDEEILEGEALSSLLERGCCERSTGGEEAFFLALESLVVDCAA